MDIVTAAQFDKDISAKLPSLDVKCGFEAEFASVIPQKYIAGALAYFLTNPDATEIDDDVTATPNAFKVSTEYITSGPSKSYKTWSIESDSTVPTDHIHRIRVELVSPVLSLPDMLKGMKSVFAMMRAKYKGTQPIGGMSATYYGDFFSLAMTSKETGLHLTFSIDGIKARDVDVLKLALLVGESHWATYLGREQHSYAIEALQNFDNYIIQAYTEDFNALGMSLNNFALSFVDAYFAARGYHAAQPSTPVPILEHAGGLSRKLHITDAKYSSVNTAKADKGLLEFRLPGGQGYENKYDKISVMAERFAYAFFAAADRSAYVEYYKNKMIYRALKVLGKFKDLKAKDLTLKVSEMAPRIIVAQGHTLLALTHPDSGKAYIVWPLTEVGENVYKFDTTRSVEHVTISRVDRRSGRTNTLFELMENFGNEYALFSKDMNQLIYGSGDATSYHSGYVKPRIVKDVRGASVTVVSTATKSDTMPDARVPILALTSSEVDALDPAAAAIVRESQSNLEPSDLDEMYLLFQYANAHEVIALQGRYKDTILSAIEVSPLRGIQFLADPLTPGTLDLTHSLSSSFTPEIAAGILSQPGFIDSIAELATSISRSAAYTTHVEKLPMLAVHYDLASYLARIKGDGAANHILSYHSLGADQYKFFIHTLMNLSTETKLAAVDTLIHYFEALHNGTLTTQAADITIAFASVLKDITEPLSTVESELYNDHSAGFLTAICSSQLKGNLSENSDPGTQIIIDYMREHWPNMYASVDVINGKAQLGDLLTEDITVTTIVSAYAKIRAGHVQDSALAYFAKHTANLNPTSPYEVQGIPALDSILYRAVFSGLFDAEELPEWAKGDPAVIVASNELLHSRKPLSEETPDSVLTVLPGLKAQLYRDFISSPTGFGPLTAGKVAGFGAVSHGIDALGAGAASFYAAVQKRANTWNATSLSAFVSGLYSMMPAAMHTVPPAPSILFDLIAQDLAKMATTTQPDRPELVDLQSKFGSYVRATKGKAKIKVDPITVEYPAIIAPVLTEVQGAFPVEWPEQSRFTPRQLASIFKSDTGESVDNGRHNQVSKADLLMYHLAAYSVDQLVELFSYPAPVGLPTGILGRSIIRSIHNTASRGDRIIEHLTVNTILAVERMGDGIINDLLNVYVRNFKEPFNSAAFFSVGGNVADIRDYFIRLAARGASEVITGDLEARSDSFETFINLEGLRPESFASKDLVPYYKFLIKNKFTSHNIAWNLHMLLTTYRDTYKSPGYRVALIDSLYAEADKKDRVRGLPSGINHEFGYPDMER